MWGLQSRTRRFRRCSRVLRAVTWNRPRTPGSISGQVNLEFARRRPHRRGRGILRGCSEDLDQRGRPVCSDVRILPDIYQNTLPSRRCRTCRVAMHSCRDGHTSWEITYCRNGCGSSRRIGGSSGRQPSTTADPPPPPRSGPKTYCPYCSDLSGRGRLNSRSSKEGHAAAEY
jgi:hypothetical protein